MSQELHVDWVNLLPLALFRLRALPKWPLFISFFELMYGWPALSTWPSLKLSPLPDHLLTPLLHHLHSLLWEFADHYLTQPCTIHCTSPINIGHQVLLSPPDQSSSPLSPKWKGPFKVIFVTPTAAKLEGLPYWIYLFHLKPFISPSETHPSYTVSRTLCSLKFWRTSKSSALPPISEE